ncbi:hypothetical protein ACIA8C_11625 [Nocardia sp. NPDC051321]|uniref:hypothetical protein n=1 Tax=Nocardia sp. NPDC051321 TaxID=3364323 RepID=UPI0037A64475
MTQREIALKKDESLLVTWMAEPFRYARLVSVASKTYLFDLHPIFDYDRKQYTQLKVEFFDDYYQVNLVNGAEMQQTHQVGRSFWGKKTVKQLLVAQLADAWYSGGYEIVDWGGFAVPDDRPADRDQY